MGDFKTSQVQLFIKEKSVKGGALMSCIMMVQIPGSRGHLLRERPLALDVITTPSRSRPLRAD